MRKIVVLVLMVMVLGLTFGCKTDGGENKTVEEQYRGTFVWDKPNSPYDYQIELTKDKVIFYRWATDSYTGLFQKYGTYSAWTEGNELWANIEKENVEGGVDMKKIDAKIGTFTNNNTWVPSMRIDGNFTNKTFVRQ